MKNALRPALAVFAALTLLCGVAYPLAVTGLAQLILPQRANGSLVEHDGKVIGSQLVGQSFTSARYFWGRPSATAPTPNNAAASSGANQGPSNPALKDAVAARIAALRTVDPSNRDAIPVDLVTASASGLDPHISPAAALYQVNRVAAARGFPRERVLGLVAAHTERPWLGLFGEARVHVLALNLALDMATEDQMPHTR
ncbi:potassium-transporting ATPase subunit KdpC [Massilia brevitalea]|uniref:potassium-transporting ATPase subunit KdpC n=1 Tax=Massilia brevitalea TaxID=442526 RepID=UPI0027384833|nr:potassium-transporting ATPase subunit KdpC [Massilia brevitalea]